MDEKRLLILIVDNKDETRFAQTSLDSLNIQPNRNWKACIISDSYVFGTSAEMDYATLKDTEHPIYPDMESAVFNNPADYILILEAGDLLLSNALEILEDTMQAHDAQIIAFAGAEYDHRSNKVTGKKYVNTKLIPKDQVFCPSELLDGADYIFSDLFISARVYKRELINRILSCWDYPDKKLHPSQLSFMALTFAESAYVLDQVLLHHRMVPYVKQQLIRGYVAELEDLYHLFEDLNPESPSTYSFSLMLVNRFNVIWNMASGYLEKRQVISLLKESAELQKILANNLRGVASEDFLRMKGLLDADDWYAQYCSKHQGRKFDILKTSTLENAPLVSIIIPVFNNEDYIDACVQSVLTQTIDNLEVICVNDGSTDHVLDHLLRLAEYDSRIVILNQENGGSSVARNNAVSIAHGKYIYFLDSDDYIDSDMLEILLQKMEDLGLDIVFFKGIVEYEEEFANDEKPPMLSNYYSRYYSYPDVYTGLEFLFKAFYRDEYRVSPVMQMIRTSFYRETSLDFFNGIMYEDNIFALRELIYARRVAYVDNPFYHRRVISSSNTMQKKRFDHIFGYYMVYRELQEIYANNHDINIKYQILIQQLIDQARNNAIAKYIQSCVEEQVKYFGLPEEMFNEIYHMVVVPAEERMKLSKEKKQKEKKTVEIKHLQKELNKKRHENKSLAEEQKKTEIDNNNLKAKLDKNESEKKNLQKELDKTENEKKILKEELGKKENENKRLQEEQNKKDKELKNTQKEFEDTKRQSLEMVKKLDDIKKSKSYRVGTLLARPCRVVKTVIRRLK